MEKKVGRFFLKTAGHFSGCGSDSFRFAAEVKELFAG